MKARIQPSQADDLMQDLVAFRNENIILQDELQKISAISSSLSQRVNELEAEIELLSFEAEFDHSKQPSIKQSGWDSHYKNAPSPMLIIDSHAKILDANSAFLDLVAEAGMTPINKGFRSFLNKESRYQFIKFIRSIEQSTNDRLASDVMQLSNGISFNCLASSISLENYSGPKSYLILIKLIDFRSLSDSSLQLSNAIIEQIHEGLMITDHTGYIVRVNQAFSEITGFSSNEVIGETPRILHSGRHSPSFYEKMWREIEHHGWWAGEVWNKRKSGEIFPEWLQISRIHDELTGRFFYVALFSDITERKSHQNQLDKLAFYDLLTSLPNRQLLNQTLDSFLHRIKVGQDYQMAIIFIDLDKFKHINDTFGHAEGDRVLKEASQRIISLIDEMDVASRIGGDEFVLLLRRDSKEAVVTVVKEILKIIAKPFVTSKARHHVSASIGIAFAPLHGNNVEDLMRRADAAMYHAKNQGRNKFNIFDFEDEVSLNWSNGNGHFNERQ